MTDSDVTLDQTRVLHRQGRLAEAAAGYRAVVAREPGNAEALHLLGLVTAALGLCDRAASNDDRPSVQEAARALLGARSADLGWDRRKDDGERIPTLRALLLSCLGTIGADPAVRASS